MVKSSFIIIYYYYLAIHIKYKKLQKFIRKGNNSLKH